MPEIQAHESEVHTADLRTTGGLDATMEPHGHDAHTNLAVRSNRNYLRIRGPEQQVHGD